MEKSIEKKKFFAYFKCRRMAYELYNNPDYAKRKICERRSG